MSVPGAFPLSFGGWFPITATVDGTSLVYLDDHAGDGANLLLSQFRDKPRLGAVLAALLAGVQDFEDAVWSVLTERWLSTAMGAQLDGLGAIVDLARSGWGDETYRTLLRAQILVLRSKGTWVDLLGILDAIGVTLSLVTAREPSMAAIRVDIDELFAEIDAADAFDLLRRAKAAGVRLSLVFLTVPVAETFCFSDGAPSSGTGRGFGDSISTDPGGGGRLAGVLSTTVIA